MLSFGIVPNTSDTTERETNGIQIMNGSVYLQADIPEIFLKDASEINLDAVKEVYERIGNKVLLSSKIAELAEKVKIQYNDMDNEEYYYSRERSEEIQDIMREAYVLSPKIFKQILEFIYSYLCFTADMCSKENINDLYELMEKKEGKDSSINMEERRNEYPEMTLKDLEEDEPPDMIEEGDMDG